MEVPPSEREGEEFQFKLSTSATPTTLSPFQKSSAPPPTVTQQQQFASQSILVPLSSIPANGEWEIISSGAFPTPLNPFAICQHPASGKAVRNECSKKTSGPLSGTPMCDRHCPNIELRRFLFTPTSTASSTDSTDCQTIFSARDVNSKMDPSEDIAKGAPLRKRRRFEVYQIEMLEKFYGVDPSPMRNDKEHIAKSCGLTFEQVTRWFSTRRRKDRQYNDPGDEITKGRSMHSSSQYTNPYGPLPLAYQTTLPGSSGTGSFMEPTSIGNATHHGGLPFGPSSVETCKSVAADDVDDDLPPVGSIFTSKQQQNLSNLISSDTGHKDNNVEEGMIRESPVDNCNDLASPTGSGGCLFGNNGNQLAAFWSDDNASSCSGSIEAGNDGKHPVSRHGLFGEMSVGGPMRHMNPCDVTIPYEEHPHDLYPGMSAGCSKAIYPGASSSFNSPLSQIAPMMPFQHQMQPVDRFSSFGNPPVGNGYSRYLGYPSTGLMRMTGPPPLVQCPQPAVSTPSTAYFIPGCLPTATGDLVRPSPMPAVYPHISCQYPTGPVCSSISQSGMHTLASQSQMQQSQLECTSPNYGIEPPRVTTPYLQTAGGVGVSVMTSGSIAAGSTKAARVTPSPGFTTGSSNQHHYNMFGGQGRTLPIRPIPVPRFYPGFTVIGGDVTGQYATSGVRSPIFQSSDFQRNGGGVAPQGDFWSNAVYSSPPVSRFLMQRPTSHSPPMMWRSPTVDHYFGPSSKSSDQNGSEAKSSEQGHTSLGSCTPVCHSGGTYLSALEVSPMANSKSFKLLGSTKQSPSNSYGDNERGVVLDVSSSKERSFKSKKNGIDQQLWTDIEDSKSGACIEDVDSPELVRYSSSPSEEISQVVEPETFAVSPSSEFEFPVKDDEKLSNTEDNDNVD